MTVLELHVRFQEVGDSPAENPYRGVPCSHRTGATGNNHKCTDASKTPSRDKPLLFRCFISEIRPEELRRASSLQFDMGVFSPLENKTLSVTKLSSLMIFESVLESRGGISSPTPNTAVRNLFPVPTVDNKKDGFQ
ncbi:hypothetical protein STEG23_027305 [Scotinomys teguina]